MAAGPSDLLLILPGILGPKLHWVRQSNEIELTEKKKNQSNLIERSIFELVIYVKQTLKIQYQILEARVTSALSVAHVFFVNEEIPQKWLEMRCGS